MPCDPHNYSKAVFLIGYRCTGKSTTGKKLAKLLSVRFEDTDRIIEERAGTTITQMVAQKGWDHFRQMETRVLKEVAGQGRVVVATGGGMVLAEENQKVMKQTGICVWLDADEKTLVARIREDKALEASRPGLTDLDLEEETRQMLALRRPMYQSLAAIQVDTARHTPGQAAQVIMDALASICG